MVGDKVHGGESLPRAGAACAPQCIAIGTGLFLLGAPYALLFGVLAGVLRFVPYVGAWAAAAMAALVSLAVFDGWREPLMVLALFALVELLIYLVVEPLLYSHRAGVSPLAPLITLAFWTWLWGPIGLILGTPLTVCLVALGRHVPEMEFIVVLFGDEPVVPTDGCSSAMRTTPGPCSRRTSRRTPRPTSTRTCCSPRWRACVATPRAAR